MIRGRRSVKIGFFFSRRRAAHVAALLDWSPDWHPQVEEVPQAARVAARLGWIRGNR